MIIAEDERVEKDLFKFIDPIYAIWRLAVVVNDEERLLKAVDLSFERRDFIGHALFSTDGVMLFCPLEIFLWISVGYFRCHSKWDTRRTGFDLLEHQLKLFYLSKEVADRFSLVKNQTYLNAFSFCAKKARELWPIEDESAEAENECLLLRKMEEISVLDDPLPRPWMIDYQKKYTVFLL